MKSLIELWLRFTEKWRKPKQWLPDKPSELILVALNDLEWAEMNPDYKIDMDFWRLYYPQSGMCLVCLAGAVAARGLPDTDLGSGNAESHPCEWYERGIVTEDERNKLRSLDSLRSGDVLGFWTMMNGGELPPVRVPPAIYNAIGQWTSYERGPDQFKWWLRQVSAAFRSEGL